jgi:DNA-binding response OmpR family regulator
VNEHIPTVVIADDSATMRRIVTSVLAKEGFNVIGVDDGVAAVQAVFAHQPDAVVMDVQMPRLSGYVAVRLLKEDWATSEVPVVLLTALDAAADRFWGEAAGAQVYLTKDFEAPQLVEAVRGVIDAAPRGLRADPRHLSDDDVLERTCETLDRTLYQASVAGQVTALATTHIGFESTVAGLLGVVGRFVDHALAGVVLVEERAALLTVSKPVSEEHFRDFLVRASEVVASASGVDLPAADLDARVADPGGLLGGDEEGHLSTFLSMPLRGHGDRVVGVLALSSCEEDGFGESALRTLRMIEAPAALVVDNARMADRRSVEAIGAA